MERSELKPLCELNPCEEYEQGKERMSQRVRKNPAPPTNFPMQKQIHVIFSGQVQGVGFRFTTESIASQLGLSGWVKNIRGGDVEVLAEGEEAALKDMVSRLEEQFSAYIVKKQVSWGPATGEFKDFGIEF